MDFGFPALLAMVLLSGDAQFLLRLLLVCVLHECGHGIAMCLTGAGLQEIRFCGAGVQMTAGTAVLSRMKALCISLAGPAVNLLCAAVSAPETAMLHLCTGLFNLLPYRCLDGGTAVRIFHDSEKLTIACVILSVLLFLLLLLYHIRNPLLYLMVLYLTVQESLRR
jgi:Zn-dependent protease